MVYEPPVHWAVTPFPQPFLPQESQVGTAREQEPGTVQGSQVIPFLADVPSQSPFSALFLLPGFPSSFVGAAQPELWVSGPEFQLPMGSALPPQVAV